MTKQDKLRHVKSKKKRDQISGKRLNIARNAKKLTWQELADGLKEKLLTVQKWADPKRNGIPESRLFHVAKYFNVSESVFADKRLSEEDFKKIIQEPALVEKFYPTKEDNDSFPTENAASEQPLIQDDQDDDLLQEPILTFRGKHGLIEGPYVQSSERFIARCKKISIQTEVWGCKGVTNTRVTVVPFDKYSRKIFGTGTDEAILDFRHDVNGENDEWVQRDSDFTSFDITTEANASISEIYKKPNTIRTAFKSDIFLVVRSECRYEVNVYELF